MMLWTDSKLGAAGSTKSGKNTHNAADDRPVDTPYLPDRIFVTTK
jgi:hypothetical protein